MFIDMMLFQHLNPVNQRQMRFLAFVGGDMCVRIAL